MPNNQKRKRAAQYAMIRLAVVDRYAEVMKFTNSNDLLIRKRKTVFRLLFYFLFLRTASLRI